mmetsp:Transcript_7190/g.21733  ORF Transcript_7190/g.21733 Transcript_7190/m.21733 type:complete len:353 (-) Transcript_7190:126-1184(-)
MTRDSLMPFLPWSFRDFNSNSSFPFFSRISARSFSDILNRATASPKSALSWPSCLLSPPFSPFVGAFVEGAVPAAFVPDGPAAFSLVFICALAPANFASSFVANLIPKSLSTSPGFAPSYCKISILRLKCITSNRLVSNNSSFSFNFSSIFAFVALSAFAIRFALSASAAKKSALFSFAVAFGFFLIVTIAFANLSFVFKALVFKSAKNFASSLEFISSSSSLSSSSSSSIVSSSFVVVSPSAVSPRFLFFFGTGGLNSFSNSFSSSSLTFRSSTLRNASSRLLFFLFVVASSLRAALSSCFSSTVSNADCISFHSFDIKTHVFSNRADFFFSRSSSRSTSETSFRRASIWP